MSEKKKRNIIIGSLCGVLLLMVVGYAAFNSVLKINGTSNINSNWDIKITKIEKIASNGATDKAGSPSYESLSATFNTDLTSPGDYATYKIEITNSGSLNAVLSSITMPNNTNNDIVFYLNKDQNNRDISDALKQNETLFKKGETGNIGYVYVTLLYRDYDNQKTAQNKTASMTITFDFTQEDASSNTPVIPGNQLTTVYAYNTDIKTIGTSTLTDGVSDYAQLDSYQNGKAWFLKYDIDSENVIQNAYACIKYTFIEEPVCVQGGKDSEGNTYYESNKTTLTNLQSIIKQNSGNCSLGNSTSNCNAGNLYVEAYSTGIAGTINYSSSSYCNIGTNNDVYCGG